MLECKTYRTRGHSRSDRNKYRSKEEIEEWKLRDPIPHFVNDLIAHGIIDQAEADAIEQSVEVEIKAGFDFAVAGTDPTPDSLTRDVYTRELV